MKKTRIFSSITLATLLLLLLLATPVFAEETSDNTNQETQTEDSGDLIEQAEQTETEDGELETDNSEEEDILEASETTEVYLTIRHQNNVVFSDDVLISAETNFNYQNNGVDINTTTNKISVLSTLITADQASDEFNISNLAYYESFSSFLLNCINLTTISTNACYNWQYVVDGVYPFVGIDQLILTGGENIYIYFGQQYEINTEGTDFVTSETITTTLSEYDYENNSFLPVVDTEIIATEPILPDYSNYPPTTYSIQTTDSFGQVNFSFSQIGNYYLTLPNSYFPGVTINVSEPNPPATRLTIRFEDTILHDASHELPTSTTFNYHNNGELDELSTTTPANTVLTLLVQADQADNNFAITDLSYYESFNSFLLNCINSADENRCFEWQYVVNGSYPAVGIDQSTVYSEDHVYLYFGNRYRISNNASEYQPGQTIITTLEEYDFSNGNFTPLKTGTLGLLTSSSLVINTTTVNEFGQLEFTAPNPPDIYHIGLENGSEPWLYYWPTSSFTVSITNTGENNQNNGNSQGGGGSNNSQPDAHKELDTEKAFEYLVNNQNEDGSFGSASLYSDWVAVAFGVNSNNESRKNKLKNYLLTDPAAGSSITDYERRAMALMSLGINPYNGVATNYIKNITDSFDGNQIGDIELFNDDIFALVVLLKAGYSATDEIITKTTSFILKAQSGNGSWGSVDLTAAAIQALTPISNINGVQNSINLAKTYLQNKQQTDGGFENIDSTSWAMQAIATLGEQEDGWQKNNHTPGDYLDSQQQTDGGVRLLTEAKNNRIWSTAYAINAQAGLPWYNILNSFSIPNTNELEQNQTNQANNNAVGGYFINEENETNNPTNTNTEEILIESNPATENIIEEKLPTPTENIIPETTNTILPTTNPKLATTLQIITSPGQIKSNNKATINEVDSTADATTNEIEKKEPTPNNKTIISPSPEPTPVDPIKNSAKKVFQTATTLATTLGAYLAWRLAQTLV